MQRMTSALRSRQNPWISLRQRSDQEAESPRTSRRLHKKEPHLRGSFEFILKVILKLVGNNYFAASSISFHSASERCTPAAAIFSSRCETDEVPGIGNITGE